MSWTNTLNNYAGGTLDFLFYAFIFLIVIALIAFFVWNASFKVNVRLRKKTSTFDRLSDTKGKFVRGKDGVKKLAYKINLFKLDYHTLPSSEAIGLNAKGKTCLELEITEEGTKRYIVKESEGMSYKPIDTNDQIFMVNEMEKRLKRQKKSLAELIQYLAPFITIIIIVGLLFGFWGEIVQPFNDAGNTNLAIAKEQKEITEMLKEIIKQEQVLNQVPKTEAPPE
jgi:hypothetical protein